LHYSTLAASGSHPLCLLDIDLYTGKTHQIRVQAASRSHPVAGDDVYGDFARNRALRRDLGLTRLFLHAHRLELIHPLTRKRLTVEAPLPDDLHGVLEKAEVPFSPQT
jgi:23S rRNA-/tRNA-specific pseudouridylate synthase